MRSKGLAAALVCLAAAALWGEGAAEDEGDLYPLPGMEEAKPAPPLPGSAPTGANPMNAAHADTLLLLEGILASGFGVGAAYERYITGLFGLEAEVGWLHGRVVAAGAVLDVISLFAGPRLSFLQSSVNGPSLGVAAGAALAWLNTGEQTWFYVWPQVLADIGVKFSLGPEARGFFLEPRVGFKFAFQGSETTGQPVPRYGRGLVAGLRLGLSF